MAEVRAANFSLYVCRKCSMVSGKKNCVEKSGAVKNYVVVFLCSTHMASYIFLSSICVSNLHFLCNKCLDNILQHFACKSIFPLALQLGFVVS